MFTNTYFWIFNALHRADHDDAPARGGAQVRHARDPADLARLGGERSCVGKFLGALGFFLVALGAERSPSSCYPPRADRRRSRRGGVGVPRDRADRGLLPVDRDLRVDADEEPDPRGHPGVRDAHPDLLGRALRVRRRSPARAEPDRLPQHLGPHGRVRARRRGHAPARLLPLGHGLLPVSRRRPCPLRRRRRRRERPRRARLADVDGRHPPRGGAPRGRQLPRGCATGSAATGRATQIYSLSEHDEEDPRRPEEARPGHGVHDARRSRLLAGGQGAPLALPGAVARRSRSSTSIRSATWRAPRRCVKEFGRPAEHRRLPLAATGRSTSRRTSSPTSTSPARGWAGRRASRRSRARRRSPRRSCRSPRTGSRRSYFSKGHGEAVARLGRARRAASRTPSRSSSASNMTVGDVGLARQGRPAGRRRRRRRGRAPHGLPGARGRGPREVPRRRRARAPAARPGPSRAGRAAARPRVRGPARQVRHPARRRHRRRPGQRPADGGRGDGPRQPVRHRSPIVAVAVGRGAAGDLPARALGDQGGEAAGGRRGDDARRDLAGRLGRDEPEEPRRRRDQEGARRHARARSRSRSRSGRRTRRRPTRRSPRLVVIGNSRFAANGAIANGANGILFANAVHWLAGSEKQIGIAPKTPSRRRCR